MCGWREVGERWVPRACHCVLVWRRHVIICCSSVGELMRCVLSPHVKDMHARSAAVADGPLPSYPYLPSPLANVSRQVGSDAGLR